MLLAYIVMFMLPPAMHCRSMKFPELLALVSLFSISLPIGLWNEMQSKIRSGSVKNDFGHKLTTYFVVVICSLIPLGAAYGAVTKTLSIIHSIHLSAQVEELFSNLQSPDEGRDPITSWVSVESIKNVPIKKYLVYYAPMEEDKKWVLDRVPISFQDLPSGYQHSKIPHLGNNDKAPLDSSHLVVVVGHDLKTSTSSDLYIHVDPFTRKELGKPFRMTSSYTRRIYRVSVYDMKTFKLVATNEIGDQAIVEQQFISIYEWLESLALSSDKKK